MIGGRRAGQGGIPLQGASSFVKQLWYFLVAFFSSASCPYHLCPSLAMLFGTVRIGLSQEREEHSLWGPLAQQVTKLCHLRS